jgi:hypothetical protein
MHLLAQATLGADAEAIIHQQHADQQLGIDRGSARMTIEIRQVGANSAQIDEPINGPKQVILGNMIFQRELVENGCLRFLSRSLHCSTLPLVRRIEAATHASIKHEFFNKTSPTKAFSKNNRVELLPH